MDEGLSGLESCCQGPILLDKELLLCQWQHLDLKDLVCVGLVEANKSIQSV